MNNLSCPGQLSDLEDAISTQIPSSPRAVPSIHIHDADDASALFADSGMPFAGMYTYNIPPENASLFHCSRGLQSEYLPLNSFSKSSELDDISELSHLNKMHLTGNNFAFPYSAGILRENGTTPSTDGGLSLSCAPSPTSSFSSLSPLFCDPMMLSDTESALSPSPATPDRQFPWSSQEFNNQSNDSVAFPPSFVGSLPNDSVFHSRSLGYGTHRRSRSSCSARREPIASKAMLEANSRRRRHDAQFECPDCNQTFTAQFSLKRHRQSHTGVRPFACSVPGCTQRFFNNSDCKRHEKSKKRHKDL